LLFNGANPKWNSDGIIFAKSNLDLLPAFRSAVEVTAVAAITAITRANDEAGEEGGVKLPADLKAASSVKETYDESNTDTERTGAINEATSGQPRDKIPVDHAPVAIFSQPVRRASRCFKSIGWYRIARLQLIEPESEELVRMLTKKWETKDRYGNVVCRQRDVSKWKESMSYRWAVVKMEKDQKAMEEMGEPKIERLSGEMEKVGGGGAWGVNEMLAEMRLKG
jgi:hypothetical protein